MIHACPVSFQNRLPFVVGSAHPTKSSLDYSSFFTLHSSLTLTLHSSPEPDYHPAVTRDANMVITIDGPAGTGKSTVANAVARRLGFKFLDTGAMYRAVALEALRRNADLENARGIAFIAKHINIDFDWEREPPTLILNGEPVSHLLRNGETSRVASMVA